MHRISTFFCLFISLMVIIGCNSSDNNSDKIGKMAQSWAEAYFNFDFDKVQALTTTDSHKWIYRAASNITEQDISVIRSQEYASTATVLDVDLSEDGTQAMVSIEMKDVLVADSIDRPMHSLPSAVFKVCVKNDGGEWKVKMEGLPQNEMQNLD